MSAAMFTSVTDQGLQMVEVMATFIQAEEISSWAITKLSSKVRPLRYVATHRPPMSSAAGEEVEPGAKVSKQVSITWSLGQGTALHSTPALSLDAITP